MFVLSYSLTQGVFVSPFLCSIDDYCVVCIYIHVCICTYVYVLYLMSNDVLCELKLNDNSTCRVWACVCDLVYVCRFPCLLLLACICVYVC